MSFEPTERYDFGDADTASELASAGEVPRFHRIPGTRAVFVRPEDGSPRSAVWGQAAIDGGWTTAEVVRRVAWSPSEAQLDQELQREITAQARSAARSAEDLDHMIDGLYRDTVEAIADAPRVVGSAIGNAAGAAVSAAPGTSAVVALLAVGALVVALR